MTKVMIKVNLYTEICCDTCNEVIHSHFDCPICKNGNEPTSMYGDSYVDVESFSCEKCNTDFKIVNRVADYDKDNTIEIEQVIK